MVINTYVLFSCSKNSTVYERISKSKNKMKWVKYLHFQSITKQECGWPFFMKSILLHIKDRRIFFYMECKHGSRTLNLLSRSTRTCRVEVSFTDRIEGKKSLGVKILTFLVTRLTWSV